MADPQTEPLLHPCPGCGTMLDITDQQPFAPVQCPTCGQSMRVRRNFGQYELQEILGAGGMGAVYKATDMNLNRPVAIKLLRREFSSNQEFLDKFDNEAKITASINHPHVVKVFSFGEDHGIYYIAMEVVDKGSLDDLMFQQKKIPEGQALEVAIQVAQGLQAAQRVGLIHRDIKPGNILFADAHTAKIVDFGLALLAAEAAEEAGEVWGTPYYVAPEKLRHDPEDFRSDMYSLGGTIFHALAGEPPFEAETPSLIARMHLDTEPESVRKYAPEVTPATAYVLDRMLKKNPDERYESYEELIEYLSYARTKLMGSIGQRGFSAVVDAVLEHAVSTVLIIALAVLGIYGFVHRDTLFKKPAPTIAKQESIDPRNVVTGEVEDKYAHAQKVLIAGDFEKAQETFRQLGRQDVPNPLGSWIRFHEALCALLTNHPKDAQSLFKKMSGGVFSDNPNDAPLANFFVSAGSLLSDDKPVEPQVASSYDTPNQETIALLAFALKDWDLGRFEDARRFIERFLISEPKDQYFWIADYKPLAEKFMADFRTYDAIAKDLSKAGTADEKSKLLGDVTKQKASLQMPGRMVEKFDQIAAELKTAVAAAPVATPDKPAMPATEAPKVDSEKHQAEAKLWEAARAKYAALIAVYNFNDAETTLASAAISEPDLAQQKANALKKAALLRGFKATLINDINVLGYPFGIFKRNNVALPPGAHRANETQISIVTQFGALPAQWSEIAPVSMLTMADYFSKRAANANAAADRLWLIGIFGVEFGMEREGRAYLDRAAQTKPEYREQIQQLFPEPNAAPAPAAQ